MFKVAIMGGIGSGKTAVTDYLAARGAVVIDADLIAREVVEPGRPAWQQLRDAFGDAVLDETGHLDRAFVADVVFNDASALKRLNHITHGAIGLEMVNQVTRASSVNLVAVAVPLFRPMHRELLGLDEVWAVLAPPEVALARLVGPRSMSEADARARLASQPSNEERRELADVVIDNTGSIEELHDAVDRILEERGLLRG